MKRQVDWWIGAYSIGAASFASRILKAQPSMSQIFLSRRLRRDLASDWRRTLRTKDNPSRSARALSLRESKTITGKSVYTLYEPGSPVVNTRSLLDVDMNLQESIIRIGILKTILVRVGSPRLLVCPPRDPKGHSCPNARESSLRTGSLAQNLNWTSRPERLIQGSHPA